jgi:hypothetical protein
VGGCATETAAPTTVSRAAAAQMIWARRRKLATIRRRSAAMERDYRPGAMAADYHPAKDGCWAARPRPSPLPKADRDGGGAGAQYLDFAHSRRRADVLSRVRSRRRAAARIQPGRRQAELHHPDRVGARGRRPPGLASMFLNALTVIAHRKRSSTRVPVRVATHREPDPRTAAPDSLGGIQRARTGAWPPEGRGNASNRRRRRSGVQPQAVGAQSALSGRHLTARLSGCGVRCGRSRFGNVPVSGPLVSRGGRIAFQSRLPSRSRSSIAARSR